MWEYNSAKSEIRPRLPIIDNPHEAMLRGLEPNVSRVLTRQEDDWFGHVVVGSVLAVRVTRRNKAVHVEHEGWISFNAFKGKNPKHGVVDSTVMWVTRANAPVRFEEFTDAHLNHLSGYLQRNPTSRTIDTQILGAIHQEQARRADLAKRLSRLDADRRYSSMDTREKLFTFSTRNVNLTGWDNDRLMWNGDVHEFSYHVEGRVHREPEDECAICNMRHEDNPAHFHSGMTVLDREGVALTITADRDAVPGMWGESPYKGRNYGGHEFKLGWNGLSDHYKLIDPMTHAPDPRAGGKVVRWELLSKTSLELIAQGDLGMHDMTGNTFVAKAMWELEQRR